jgi:hypothetical protein
MKPVLRKSFFVLFALTVGFFGGCTDKKATPEKKQQTTPVPNPKTDTTMWKAWTPDPKMLVHLREEPFDLSETKYTICPPKDYQFERRRDDGNRYSWKTEIRDSDTTYAKIDVIFLSMPQEMQGQSLEALLNYWSRNDKLRYSEFSRAPLEYGTINGMKFMRSRFSGLRTGIVKFQEEIITYLMLDGNNLVGIEINDVDPHHKETLPILEAAALTLKRN